MSKRPFSSVEIATERLRLRPLQAADAESLYAIFSNPEVMRYWSNPPWTTLAEAHEMIAKDQSNRQANQYLRLGIEDKATSRLIGMCALYSFMHQCRRAELGYALHHEFWGGGYMREALTAFLGYGFAELNLNRIEADIDPRNVNSQHALERLGFVKEGVLRERWIVEGEVSDTGFYGLLARDWANRTKSE